MLLIYLISIYQQKKTVRIITKNKDYYDWISKSIWIYYKKDFLNIHPEYEETTVWSECKILFTDDLNSTSSKMKKANKLGIEIKTYE